MYLPCRTSLTPVKPRLLSACSMAFPCGSRTPVLRVILMLAFTVQLPPHPSSSRPKRCEPQASNAARRDLGRFHSLHEVPDSLGPAALGFRDDGWRAHSIRLGADQHRSAPPRARAAGEHAEP